MPTTPPHSGLLPIGMFSRASSLSIKALRAYHEGGILVPARVDPDTGYRSYTVDQLADAAIVTRLRALDLPLEKVREILVARDPDLTQRILAEHQVSMQERLAVTERIVAELQSGLASITHTPVHVREEPAMDTLRIMCDVDASHFLEWMIDSFGRIRRFMADNDIPIAGPLGALFSPQIADDYYEYVEAFIPIPAPVAVPAGAHGISLGEVPAARVAVLVHTGDYDTMGDTYRSLGAWVSRNAEHADERVREWYVVNTLDGVEPAAYRTEIAWPVLRPGS